MKTLIVYFSWSGNTKHIVDGLNKEFNFDTIKIERKIPYSSDYNTCAYIEAKEEWEKKILPEINDINIEISEYSRILLLFPIWWYDLPRPVATFVNEYDFSGKTVIPFFTHNGSSTGASSLSTLGSLIGTANYQRNKVLSIRGSSVSSSTQTINDWALSLDL